MTYQHNAKVYVRYRTDKGTVLAMEGRIDDNLRPEQRRNLPPGHWCVCFPDGGQMAFSEKDMQLIPERNR